jgi:hypothetical protein
MAASKTLTRAQRIERARKAGQASHSLEHYVSKVVDRAPELTTEQRDRLATLLRDS